MNVDRGLQWYGQLLNLAIKNVDEDEGSGLNSYTPYFSYLNFF